MAIAALVLWIATAAAGVTVLRAGGARRRALAERAEAPLVRIGAVPLTAEGKPPPTPHVRVSSPAGEHPLLEFSHPALAVTGSACWFMYTFVHYQTFAWIAVAILAMTLLLGLSWFARNRQAAARRLPGAWPFPPRLLVLHGGVAAASLTLSVLTALVASHG